MKIKKFLCAGVLLFSCMLGFSQSVLPTFQTFTSAEGSTAANVIIPQKPQSQVRVVSVIGQSDKATSSVKFYSGTTARYVGVATASPSSTIVLLDSTNGLSANCLLYVQGATSNVVGTVSSFTTTNISSVTYGYLVMSAAIGIPQIVNAEAEILQTTPVTFSLGAKTNQVWGSDGLFVGNYGRAAYVAIDGTSDCLLNAVTVHYDAASQ